MYNVLYECLICLCCLELLVEPRTRSTRARCTASTAALVSFSEIQYGMLFYSEADISQLNLPLGANTHTHTHSFNGPFSGTTRVSRYQKGKNNLDFTEARDSEWQWHQLGDMQVCTLLQTDNHASNPPLSFLQAGCPSCRPTNSVKALKGCAIVYK